jgi:hypothetical protein
MPGILLSSKSHEQSSTSAALYSVVDTIEKGRRAEALTLIRKGTRILAAKPLMVVSEPAVDDEADIIEAQLKKDLYSLPRDTQETVLQLHNAFLKALPQLTGILKSNAFTLPESKLGLFREACLANHSCRPNVDASWNGYIGCMVMHATTDITPGEELTHNYLNIFDRFLDRQADLEKDFAFTCRCEICSVSRTKSFASDKRRQQMRECEEIIAEMILATPTPCLYATRRMLELLADEGIGGYHGAKAYYDAFRIAIAHADMARASVFGCQAFERAVLFKGNDASETKMIKVVMKKPSLCKMYRDSRVWKTTSEDVPDDLGEDDFKEWLWNPEVKVVCSSGKA